MMLANGTLQITNASASTYACTIDPREKKYTLHAHGSCAIPADGPAFSIPVTSAAAAAAPQCSTADDTTTAAVRFSVVDPSATQGQQIWLVGGIPQLGDWDPARAVLLPPDDAAGDNGAYEVTVDIPAGYGFEYKYIVQDVGGGETWECCENRVGSVAEGACGDVSVGNAPDYFRGGGYPVEQ